MGLRGRDPSKYSLGVHGERETGRSADGATTYLRGRVHLLGAMHCQGNLATLAAWGCALHHQTLCGESLEPGGKGPQFTHSSLSVAMSTRCQTRRCPSAVPLLAHRTAPTVPAQPCY